MTTPDPLTSLGWDETWSRHFAPLAAADRQPARVTVEHRDLYHYEGAAGEGTAHVSGRLRHEAVHRADLPAVGDWVVLEPTKPGSPAVIHAILPRRNKFSRTASGPLATEQIVAANLDTLFVVTSLNRDLNPRRLERYVAAATAPRLEPVLVLSKGDLCERPDEEAERLSRYLGVAVLAVSAFTGAGCDRLLAYLRPGTTTAMVGSSGVGKSTLLNRLLGDERQSVQGIREADDRGRHTTSHRELFHLPSGGLLIDNPGLRELQLWDEGEGVDGSFNDVAALAQSCRFADCRHDDEPGCAVQSAIEQGTLDSDRLESYRKLQRELAHLERRRDSQAERELKEQGKRIHRIMKKEYKRRQSEGRR